MFLIYISVDDVLCMSTVTSICNKYATHLYKNIFPFVNISSRPAENTENLHSHFILHSLFLFNS